jgi:hypothetical protein
MDKKCIFKLGLCVLLQLLSAVGYAQTTPMPATLREVTSLLPADEPPGGLIPYRAGQLLAYADTSGQLRIAPFGRWPGMENTRFFERGFVIIHPLLKLVTPLPGNAVRQREPVRLAVLNARGEVLLVRRSEAAVRQPDGSLRCVPHWLAHGQPELWELPTGDLGIFDHFESWTEAPALPFYDNAPARATGVPFPDTLTWDYALPHALWLGVGCVAQEYNAPADKINAGNERRWALGDWQGRALTPFRFANIQRFSEGVTVAELAGRPRSTGTAAQRKDMAKKHPPQFVYLDTTGRQLINAVFDLAEPFRYGRALVGKGERMGVIDRKGDFVVPLGKHWVSGTDREGYVALEVGGDGKTPGPVQLLAPPGKPAISQLFADVQGFWQGRAEVRLGERAGLIDAAGRWVTPLPYEILRTPGKLRSAADDSDHYGPRGGEPPPPTNKVARPFFLPDSTLLVGVREGKIGLVARPTGQEVVPARYDVVVLNPCHGMACLQRSGINYLVSSFNGQEVAATYQGYDFLTPQGRRLVVTRRLPKSWALADTLAQLRTPWLPGTGYPTPQGHLLSIKDDVCALYSMEGKELLKDWTITQPEWGNIWSQIEGHAWYDAHSSDELQNAHYQLPLARYYRHAQGCYYAKGQTSGILRIYDARLNKIGTLPFPARGGNQQLILVECGWSILIEYTGKGRDIKAVTRQVFTDAGQPLPLPPTGTRWMVGLRGDYPRMWQTYGVLPTTSGYVTRGRRALWAN